MSVKNSAGVKFNDATELIIQADPDGTVESVFNKSNNTEYVGGSGGFEECTITITNKYSSQISQPYIKKSGVDNTYWCGGTYDLQPNTPVDLVTMKGTSIQLLSSYKWQNLSGDCELIAPRLLYITGDCSAEIVQV